MRPFKAVIFDLYGTLIDNYSMHEYRSLCQATAAILGVDNEDFYRLWEPTFPRRATGIEGGSEFFLREACARLNVPANDEAIMRALELRLDWARRYLASRPWSAGVVQRIRAAGYPLALVSDCTWELPRIWPESSLAACFDAVVFSCEEGMKKPDPRLFLKACSALGTGPADCLYIGDGGSSELSAVSALGMQAIQLEMPHELDLMSGGYGREAWSGQRIAHIDELPALLGLTS